MPPGSGSADQLRARAHNLRAAASKVEASTALDLYRRAGGDVWLGPTPAHCLDDMLQIRASLQTAGDDLRDAARCLEQHADQLDALARAATTTTTATPTTTTTTATPPGTTG